MSREEKSLIQWASELAHDRLIESYWRRAEVDEVLQSSVGKRWEMPMLPEPMPHHDGTLVPIIKPTKYFNHTAYVAIFDDNPPTALVSLSGGYTSYTEEVTTVYLDPKQALSLLAWLEQEKATLERLAKERAE